jgi:hypothetical protein
MAAHPPRLHEDLPGMEVGDRRPHLPVAAFRSAMLADALRDRSGVLRHADGERTVAIGARAGDAVDVRLSD